MKKIKIFFNHFQLMFIILYICNVYYVIELYAEFIFNLLC